MTVGPGYGEQGRAYEVPSPGPGYQGQAYGRARMRAADTDRERAVDYLKVAFTEGRLSKDEYDTRTGRALSAQTYADLDTLMADLRVPVTPMAAPRPANGLAIASLACGLGQFVVGPLSTIPAIVLGHVARHQIKQTGEGGAGMALAGLLLGWGAVALAAVVIAIVLVVFVAMAHGQVVHALPQSGSGSG